MHRAFRGGAVAGYVRGGIDNGIITRRIGIDGGGIHINVHLAAAVVLHDKTVPVGNGFPDIGARLRNRAEHGGLRVTDDRDD